MTDIVTNYLLADGSDIGSVLANKTDVASSIASINASINASISTLSYVSNDQNYGNVGSFCFCGTGEGYGYSPGTLVAGSMLCPASVMNGGYLDFGSGGILAGTWRLLGSATTGNASHASLYQRVA